MIRQDLKKATELNQIIDEKIAEAEAISGEPLSDWEKELLIDSECIRYDIQHELSAKQRIALYDEIGRTVDKILYGCKIYHVIGNGVYDSGYQHNSNVWSLIRKSLREMLGLKRMRGTMSDEVVDKDDNTTVSDCVSYWR